MRLTDSQKSEAYELATHQLINAMITVRHYVILADQGAIDLMNPDTLDGLKQEIFSDKINGAMVPLVTYMKRKENT